MERIDPKLFIKACEDYSTKQMGYFVGMNLSVKEKAIAEATVYFLNQIIDEHNKVIAQLSDAKILKP